MAVPFIKHTPLGKATQKEPYTAAAHLRYITRKAATVFMYSERIALNPHAAGGWLSAREDRIRKNGRICDKLTISLPREMTMEQAIDTVRNFGFQLSDGRAPFYFTLQDWNTHNPHCHFVFVDEDIQTGQKVFRTSERGSTDRIKELWERVCNSELERLGIDARIDFEDAAQKKREREAANDNALEEAVEPIPEFEPLEPEPEPDEPEEPDEGELEMATIEYPQAEETISRAEWLGNLRSTVNEMHVLDRKRREYVTAETQYKHWRQEAVKARQTALEAEQAYMAADKAHYMAEEEHKKTHLLGWKLGVKLGPWKSQGYKRAEEAERNLQSAEYRLGLLAESKREASAYAEMAKAKVQEYEDKLMGEERQMARIDKVYGKQMLFDEAEQDLKNTFAHLTKDITPEHVLDMHNNGEISWAEAREYLHFMGHDDVIAEVERDQGIQ